MSDRARCQVDDEHGTAVAFVDLDLPDTVRNILDPIVDPLTKEQRLLVLARLVRAKADEAAYERVCRDQGLLR